MNKNLEFYIKKTPSFLNKNICNQTIKELKQLEDWKQHTFYDHIKKETVNQSGEQELDVTFSNVSTLKFIMDKLHIEIQNYMNYINFNWYNGWAGYTQIRFNRYEKSKKMANHCDHIQSIFPGEPKGIPTLSMLCVLNENYKGGEFIMFDNTEIKFKQGDLIIFPSIFLYPHRVEPVTKGVRYSFISWVY